MRRASESRFTFKRTADDTVECAFFGRVTPEITEESAREVVRLLRERRARFYFCDATSVTAVAPSIAGPAAAGLKNILAEGVEEVIAVTPLSAARMLGMAIAFASRSPVRFFGDRQDALEYMARRRP